KLVFYGDNNNWFAAFAYWVARIYGHRDVALMNGGRKKWEMEGRELVTDLPVVAPTAYTASAPGWTRRPYRGTVQQDVNAPDKPRVAGRSPAEFWGEVLAPPGLPETAQRAGHIPGAANIPWGQAANEDGTFKSRPELVQLYGGKGVTA